MTVKDAVFEAYKEMPEVFHVLKLVNRVKIMTQRPHVMDGTITRLLRRLRQDGVVSYTSDKSEHNYQKVIKGQQMKLF